MGFADCDPGFTLSDCIFKLFKPKAEDGPRHLPIAAVVISNGDMDCIVGLLSLRESQPFALYADGFVQRILFENWVFRVLGKRFVVFMG